jgi:plasmid stability protein
VKNITVAIDDETYRRARVKAAEQGSSVSALVRRYLSDVAADETEFERKKRAEAEVRKSIGAFRGADRLSRDELHDRGVG